MRQFSTISYIFLLIFPLVLVEAIYAQSCDNNLKPVKSYRTQYRARADDRCEGFYESTVSSGSLNIVGVTRGKFKYKFDPKEKLTVSSPIVNSKTVNVRAVGIPLKTYYRMDAQISPDGSLEWPVGDILYHQELRYKTIGVFGWLGSEREKTYVPVKVASAMLSAPEDNTIYVYLRASIDVMNVRWRFADLSADGICAKAGGWTKPQKSKYYSGQRIVCKVPANKDDSICITVRANAQEGDEALSCEAKIILN